MENSADERWPGRFQASTYEDIGVTTEQILVSLLQLLRGGKEQIAPTRPFVNKQRIVFERRDEFYASPKKSAKLVPINQRLYEFSDTSEFADFRTFITDKSSFGILEIALDRSDSVGVLRYVQLLLLWKYTMLENFLIYPRVACIDFRAWYNTNWDIAPTSLTHEVIHVFYGLVPILIPSSMAGIVLKLRKAFMADGTCIYDSDNILSHQDRNSIQTDLVSLLIYEQVEVVVHGPKISPPTRSGFDYSIVGSDNMDKRLLEAALRSIRPTTSEDSRETQNSAHFSDLLISATTIRTYTEYTFSASHLALASIMVYSDTTSRITLQLEEPLLSVFTDDEDYLVCGAILSMIMDSIVLYTKPSEHMQINLLSYYDEFAISADLKHFLETLKTGVDWRLFPPHCGKELIDNFMHHEKTRALSPLSSTLERSYEAKERKNGLFYYQRSSKTLFPLLVDVEDTPFLRLKGKSENMMDEAGSDNEQQYESTSYGDEVSDVSVGETSKLETGARSYGGESASRSDDANASILFTAKTQRTKNTKQENRQIVSTLLEYQWGNRDNEIHKLRRAPNIYQIQALASVAIGSLQNELNFPGRYRTLENCLLGYGVWNGNSNKSMLYAAGDVFASGAWETSESLTTTRLEWRHALFVLTLALYFNLSIDSPAEAWRDKTRVQKLTRHLQDYMLYRPRVDVWYLNYFDIELLEAVKSRKDAYGRLLRELPDEMFVIEPVDSGNSRIIRHDPATGEFVDMVDVFSGLHITGTLVPLLAPSIAEDTSAESREATLHPVSSNPATTNRSEFLSSMAGAVYWTCMFAGTDALRLYGPLAIASMVVGHWRDYSENELRQQLPIANHVRRLFLDDCTGVDAIRSSTGFALSEVIRSRDIQRLIEVPIQYASTLIDPRHPLHPYLGDIQHLSDLFLAHGEFPSDDEEGADATKTMSTLVGVDGPGFIHNLFTDAFTRKAGPQEQLLRLKKV